MACVTPLQLKNENGGSKPSFRFVPCGKCGKCQEARRNQWTFRNQVENKHAKASQWVTLTYDDENIPKNDEGLFILSKDDLQRFFKRLRKANAAHWLEQVRYYAVGEYGTDTKRPHYHILLYNLHPNVYPKIKSIWGNGHVYLAPISDADIHYTTKYHLNKDVQTIHPVPEFTLMSRRPAIGYQYIEPNMELHQTNLQTFVYQNGHKTLMPRYYKNKIFSKEQLFYIQSNSVSETQKRQEIETQYLAKKGFENPEEESFQRNFAHAKKIKHKAKKANKL